MVGLNESEMGFHRLYIDLLGGGLGGKRSTLHKMDQSPFNSYRSDHVKLCIRASLKLWEDDPTEVHAGMVFAFNDPFKHCMKAQIMNLLVDTTSDKDKKMRLTDKVTSLIYDLEQLKERRGCVRNCDFTQVEHLYFLTREPLNIISRALMHYHAGRGHKHVELNRPNHKTNHVKCLRIVRFSSHSQAPKLDFCFSN